MAILRICIPSKVHVNAKFTMCLLNILPQIRDQTGYTADIKFLCGKSNIDQARSMMATDFYDQCGPDDLMLFIDSDHIFNIEDVKNAIALGGDVTCGIYPNAAGQPTCFMMNPQEFLNGNENLIRYAGTGFMLIKHTILTKLHEHLKTEGIDRARISGPDYNAVVPFFKQRIVDTELGPTGTGIRDWLGEDYSFCYMVRKIGGTIRGFHTKTLGHEVANIRFFYPENTGVGQKGPQHMYKLPVEEGKLQLVEKDIPEPSFEINIGQQSEVTNDISILKNNEIVYFCGLSRVKFSPDHQSLGGSEQAVVNLSREWVKAGFNVSAYGNVEPGTYDGVNYYTVDKFNLKKEYNCLILWRGFGLQILPMVNAKHLYVDLHDPTAKEMLPTEHLNKIEKIFVKSEWHKTNWDHLPVEKYVTIRNGMNVALYDEVLRQEIPRNEFDMCYTSCYTRGLLDTLQKSWPIIKKNIPEARLHVCYGDDLITDADLKNTIRSALEQDGIVNHGRISAEEVAKLKASCAVHYYLCTAPNAEIDCISVRESYYAGCIPFTFKEGVFIERQGIMIPAKHDDTRAYEIATVNIINLLRQKDILNQLREKPKKETDWNHIATEWLKYLEVEK